MSWGFRITAMPLDSVDAATIADFASDMAALHPDRIIDVRRSSVNISGRPEELHQAIVTLVENALRYSPENEPVSIVIDNPVGSEVVTLGVIDRRPCVDPETAELLFQPFYRSDFARSRCRARACDRPCDRRPAPRHGLHRSHPRRRNERRHHASEDIVRSCRSRRGPKMHKKSCADVQVVFISIHERQWSTISEINAATGEERR
jgi:hypothetical protein